MNLRDVILDSISYYNYELELNRSLLASDVTNSIDHLTRNNINDYIKKCEERKKILEDHLKSTEKRKPTPEEIEKFRLAKEKKRNERRCPSCGNILVNDKTFYTIWKCNVSDCQIDTIIINNKKDLNVKMKSGKKSDGCGTRAGLGVCNICKQRSDCKLCIMKIGKEHDFTCEKCLIIKRPEVTDKQ